VVARVLVLQKQLQLATSQSWIKPTKSRGVAGGQKFRLGKVLALPQLPSTVPTPQYRSF
jgi:hypothetical protein